MVDEYWAAPKTAGKVVSVRHRHSSSEFEFMYQTLRDSWKFLLIRCLQESIKPGDTGSKRGVTALMSLIYSELAWKEALWGNNSQRVN